MTIQDRATRINIWGLAGGLPYDVTSPDVVRTISGHASLAVLGEILKYLAHNDPTTTAGELFTEFVKCASAAHPAPGCTCAACAACGEPIDGD